MFSQIFKKLLGKNSHVIIEYPMTDEFMDAHPDVIGESKYQDNLEHIAGGKSEKSAEIAVDAFLIPEPANKHDENAIRVEVAGKQVGYINREAAKLISRALSKVSPRPHALRLDAYIVGGWDRGDGDVGYFGVKFPDF